MKFVELTERQYSPDGMMRIAVASITDRDIPVYVGYEPPSDLIEQSQCVDNVVSLGMLRIMQNAGGQGGIEEWRLCGDECDYPRDCYQTEQQAQAFIAQYVEQIELLRQHQHDGAMAHKEQCGLDTSALHTEVVAARFEASLYPCAEPEWYWGIFVVSTYTYKD